MGKTKKTVEEFAKMGIGAAKLFKRDEKGNLLLEAINAGVCDIRRWHYGPLLKEGNKLQNIRSKVQMYQEKSLT